MMTLWVSKRVKGYDRTIFQQADDKQQLFILPIEVLGGYLKLRWLEFKFPCIIAETGKPLFNLL